MDDSPYRGTIFIVDDEDMVLTSIESFLALETDYEVQTFPSPMDALAKAAEVDVNLIISDYLMPDMDGIAFLAEIRDLKPDVTRIILTGYADKENAIKAINEVGLFQYIEKPWDNDQLLIIIRNGLDKHYLLRNLREKMDQINKAYSDLQGIQQDILKTFA